uniref:Calbindin 2a n=1 Tax=Mastacembelus armatus TaxID=205130 RepID=A0A7N8YKB5_9TELE
MANKAQQPPHLHLAEVTASQFLDIWKHFDSDGNGYIEGKELENFFRELETARRGAGVDPSNPIFREKMKEFMQKFDKNKDGRIEMSELAQILPTEENFLLCFRQFVSSSSEFMAVSVSTFVCGFLSDLLEKANRHYDDEKLQEYTQTILKMFDLNGDGKLGLSEMARLLPVQENFLLKFQGVKLTTEQFGAIFAYYDKLYSLHGISLFSIQEVDLKNLTGYKQSIMSLSDGGKLYRGELEIVLCREPIV